MWSVSEVKAGVTGSEKVTYSSTATWLKMFLTIRCKFCSFRYRCSSSNTSPKNGFGVFLCLAAIHEPVNQGWTYQQFKTSDGVAFRVIAARTPFYHDKLAT